MLLFIALANAHYFLRGDTVLGGFPMDGSALDSAVTWVIATFVDGRAFPMFGLLFGYGVAHIVQRQKDAGRPAVRRLLWRRSFALIVIGGLHGLLLFPGDILATYGVLLLFGALTVFWRDRWLLAGASLFLFLIALPGSESASTSASPPHPSMLPSDLVSQFSDRIAITWYIALLGPLGFACPFLVGLWAGRRRVLERPLEHRTLLRVVAVGGIAAAVVGAQPAAWVLSGLADRPSTSTLEVIGPLHDASGILGGFGFAALIALVASRVGEPRPRVVQALAATGQRSMTCYLAQSVVWSVVFTPYLLDLSATLSVAATALLSIMTWVATVALASWMDRTGRRGPFEVLMRRVTYGRTRASST